MKMREIEICIGGLLILIVFFVGIAHKIAPQCQTIPQSEASGIPYTSTSRLRFGNTTLDVLIARSESEREKGLGDRVALPAEQGMLFIFPEPGIYPFWMKGMRFPLDIIWLAAPSTVVHVEKNVSPDTYPKIYASLSPADYVLEVNAGVVEKNGIKAGDRCTLQALN